MKTLFLIQAALLLSGCGGRAPVGVRNELTLSITSVHTLINGSLSENLIQTPIPPGGSQSFPANRGSLHILAIDENGNTYEHRASLGSEGVIWAVTPDNRTGSPANPWAGLCPVTVTNNLAQPISAVYCSPSSHSEWGENWAELPLQPGQTLTFTVEEGQYDLRLHSGLGRYTRWRVGVSETGYSWTVLSQHRDSSG